MVDRAVCQHGSVSSTLGAGVVMVSHGASLCYQGTGMALIYIGHSCNISGYINVKYQIKCGPV